MWGWGRREVRVGGGVGVGVGVRLGHIQVIDGRAVYFAMFKGSKVLPQSILISTTLLEWAASITLSFSCPKPRTRLRRPSLLRADMEENFISKPSSYSCRDVLMW